MIDGLVRSISAILIGVIFMLVYMRFADTLQSISQISWPKAPDYTENEEIITKVVRDNGLLHEGPGVGLVKKHCLGCHNEQLIVQNRMEKDRWQSTIRWMQRTQGLWELGPDEPVVLDYLSTFYAPEQIGRRRQLKLDQSDWYILQKDASTNQ